METTLLLDSSSPWRLGGCLFTVLLLAYVSYNLYLHPLASLPGPFIARSGLWSYRVNRAILRDACE
jgi:hypothetical protein